MLPHIHVDSRKWNEQRKRKRKKLRWRRDNGNIMLPNPVTPPLCLVANIFHLVWKRFAYTIYNDSNKKNRTDETHAAPLALTQYLWYVLRLCIQLSARYQYSRNIQGEMVIDEKYFCWTLRRMWGNWSGTHFIPEKDYYLLSPSFSCQYSSIPFSLMAKYTVTMPLRTHKILIKRWNGIGSGYKLYGLYLHMSNW